MTVTPEHREAHGVICPTCRFCQDQRLGGHLCITRGDQPAPGLELASIYAAYRSTDEYGELIFALGHHPAEPLGWSAENPDIPVLLAVDRTWCECQCSTGPATPRTREAQPA